MSLLAAFMIRPSTPTDFMELCIFHLILQNIFIYKVKHGKKIILETTNGTDILKKGREHCWSPARHCNKLEVMT